MIIAVLQSLLLQLVDAMDNILYDAYTRYFHALEVRGYLPHKEAEKLLVLNFYRDFVFHDYWGVLTKEDYLAIEKALDCLYGSTCLIPYPDYLKMGKLHLGQVTEIAHRLKTLEGTQVLKTAQNPAELIDPDSDVMVMQKED